MSDDLKNDLAAAFDKAAPEPTPAAAPAPEPTPAAAPAPEPTPAAAASEPSGPARDASGRFAPKAAGEPPKAPEAPLPGQQTLPGMEPPKAPEAPPAAPKAPEAPPPRSWKADVREEWGKLPPAVKAEVARREREISTALQESAEARQGYQKFKEVVAPYEPMLRAENVDPVSAVKDLLQTAAALRTAPPAQKAQMLVNMIKTFGVSVQMMDDILAGDPASAQAAPQQQAYRDPRVDQLMARLQQAEQQRSSAVQEQAQKVYEQVSQWEFFEDVREDMADILQMAAQRRLTLSPEDAYHRAILMHPEIVKVMEQREAAKAANPSGSTQASRQAASSVRSSPVTPGGPATPDDLRGAVEAAFEKRRR